MPASNPADDWVKQNAPNTETAKNPTPASTGNPADDWVKQNAPKTKGNTPDKDSIWADTNNPYSEKYDPSLKQLGKTTGVMAAGAAAGAALPFAAEESIGFLKTEAGKEIMKLVLKGAAQGIGMGAGYQAAHKIAKSLGWID